MLHSTLHAEYRTMRLRMAGLDEEAAAQALIKAGEIAAQYPSCSVAARVVRVPRSYGMRDSGSNGDEVWAICREGRVVTMMLRRSEQPASPGAMSVDKVVL